MANPTVWQCLSTASLAARCLFRQRTDGPKMSKIYVLTSGRRTRYAVTPVLLSSPELPLARDRRAVGLHPSEDGDAYGSTSLEHFAVRRACNPKVARYALDRSL